MAFVFTPPRVEVASASSTLSFHNLKDEGSKWEFIK